MGGNVQGVADAELAILEELWKAGTLTVRQLTDALYHPGTEAQCATVQKLLERLEAKDCVSRDRQARPHVYHATIDRDELIARRLRETADRLCGGSVIPLLTNLIRTSRLNAQERREVRSLLNELEMNVRPKSAGPDLGDRS